jgi:hypothetical protein
MARTKHPKYTGAIASARIEMESKAIIRGKETLRLTFNVTYKPHGVPVEHLQSNLEGMVETAMNNGTLTGDSPAEVISSNYNVAVIPQPVKEKKAKGRFHEGSTRVCAHNVSFYYRLPARVRISKDELFQMTEAVEERAMECIVQGFIQGELNYETDRFQATGWWRINNE